VGLAGPSRRVWKGCQAANLSEILQFAHAAARPCYPLTAAVRQAAVLDESRLQHGPSPAARVRRLSLVGRFNSPVWVGQGGRTLGGTNRDQHCGGLGSTQRRQRGKDAKESQIPSPSLREASSTNLQISNHSRSIRCPVGGSYGIVAGEERRIFWSRSVVVAGSPYCGREAGAGL